MTERVILKGLLYSDDYVKQVFPFLKEEYFEDEEQIVYLIIKAYIDEYNSSPSLDVLTTIMSTKDILEKQYDECITIIEDITSNRDDLPKLEWLTNETEVWCKNRSLYIAALKLVEVIQGKDNTLDHHGLPGLMQDAVSVCFDNRIGHEYFIEAEQQYDYYHELSTKIPSRLQYINDITGGGPPTKTLLIFMAEINGGKSIWLVDRACDHLEMGKNVLFCSFEMDEQAIRQRCDANLMNVEMDSIKDLTKDQYINRVDGIKKKTQGKLFIKQFGSGEAHIGHIRHLCNEIKIKQGIEIDMLVVDYLGIMASAKLPPSAISDSNRYFQEVAKELHSFAKEKDIIVWSAMQYNRGGQNASDVTMSDIACSIGVANTADLIICGISNNEMEEEGVMLLKLEKNRLSRKDTNKFVSVKIDRPRMRYYDRDNSVPINTNQANVSSINKKQKTKSNSNNDWSF